LIVFTTSVTIIGTGYDLVHMTNLEVAPPHPRHHDYFQGGGRNVHVRYPRQQSQHLPLPLLLPLSLALPLPSANISTGHLGMENISLPKPPKVTGSPPSPNVRDSFLRQRSEHCSTSLPQRQRQGHPPLPTTSSHG
jgi:hypothetical protein